MRTTDKWHDPSGSLPKTRLTPRTTHICLVAALASTGVSTAPPRVSRTVPLPEGSVVSIESTVGDVEIRGERRQDLAVEIDAPDGLDARIDEGPGAIRISAMQTNGGMDRAIRTRISVRTPARATFESVQLLDGRLTLNGLSGAVNANVRQGSIEAAAVAGRLRLETGFGDVKVESATLDPDGLLRLRAFNGSVRLAFARPPADARILALSFNGTIRSDVPLARKESFGPRFGEARLGNGQPVVSIDVITGDIVIASAAAPPR
jgi:DUF4097 and DUF4098 domain-containing protein YvlB